MSDAVRAALKSQPLDIDALAAALDALDERPRVAAIRAMGGKDQARIWAAAEGRQVHLADMVPEGVAPATEVVHAGKNSLPGPNAVTFFEKRFARTTDDPDVAYGYNEGKTRKLIGPGYFVLRWYDDRGESGVDYYSVPPRGTALPAGWPKVQPNEKGLQVLVFAKMIDYLRKVSDSVTIGRAYKKGKVTDNYFLLCRTGV